MAPSAPRMTGEARREQILDAALAVFAEGGYDGTTTDQVARAAGVSQPYVVRLFGSKQELFRELYATSCESILDTFTAVPAGPDADQRMAGAYVELLSDRNLQRLVMHGFTSTDPEVSRLARHTLAQVFRLYRERTGADEDAARDFLAQGMLINILLSTDAPAHSGEDPVMDLLVRCAVTDELAYVLGTQDAPAPTSAADRTTLA
ncbi:TetR/AcrR family transcriptional regulator [Cellulomonas sp. P22]|uniref:TetR/AcrR family transcriptional regulator n=1 Tax=Cellulomonas sp. P22 TaxID=3373189 RepID=UPI0037B03507